MFLTQSDLKRISFHLERPVSEFAEYKQFDWTRFAAWKTRQWVFKLTNDGKCQFFKNGKCGIYESRPIQCKTYPYWPENLTPQGVFTEAVKKACPGIGKGNQSRSLEYLKLQIEADNELRRIP